MMFSLPDSHISFSPTACSLLTVMRSSPARSMRTVRTNIFQNKGDYLPDQSPTPVGSDSAPEILMDDFRLQELGDEHIAASAKPLSPDHPTDLVELSRDLSYFSTFNSDISDEIMRLASVCNRAASHRSQSSEVGVSAAVSTEILDSASLETAQPVVRSCVETLMSSAPAEEKRAAAGKIRLLAKHRSDFRELIGASGAIQALVHLLRSTDPATQENAVTSLLNLSLEESNKARITDSGAIMPLVYVLRMGTPTAKQNAACALLNLSINDDSKITIGVCGAIPPLVSLLMTGSTRGKKDALTTLYKLCSTRQNKERAVNAGAVTPLVALVAGGCDGTAEKATVVLHSLSTIEQGRKAIVEEEGIPALVEAVETGPENAKEFIVLTLLQLCANSERNRVVLVREGAIPLLIQLSQSTAGRTKHKVDALLKCLRLVEARAARQQRASPEAEAGLAQRHV